MKKKIFSLLLIFTMFFGFTIINVEAQAEFIDDNTFVVSNSSSDFNETDTIEFLLLLVDYAETYDLFYYDELENVYYADLENSDLDINLVANLPNFDYKLTLQKGYDIETSNFWYLIYMVDYEQTQLFDLMYIVGTNDFSVLGIGSYPFTVTIYLPTPAPPQEPPLTIFGFFKNFYSNYIFPDNLLDTQTLNLITAVTTLMFFVGVFRGIYSIFKSKRK